MARDTRLVVGAGPVLTVDQVVTAVDAGAAYIVTPGHSRDVVRACQERESRLSRASRLPLKSKWPCGTASRW